MADIRVLLVNDELYARIGLRFVLDQCADIEVIGEASNTDEAMALVESTRPTVVVLDIRTALTAGCRSADSWLRVEVEPRPAVLITVYEPDDGLRDAVWDGASGVLLGGPHPTQLISAVRMVAAGYRLRPWMRPLEDVRDAEVGPTATRQIDPDQLSVLTVRELDVLRLLSRGHSNAEISAELGRAQTTVKSHISSILFKLGLPNRVHAVIYAYEVGLTRVSSGAALEQAE